MCANNGHNKFKKKNIGIKQIGLFSFTNVFGLMMMCLCVEGVWLRHLKIISLIFSKVSKAGGAYPNASRTAAAFSYNYSPCVVRTRTTTKKV